jgi:hypothetical protein
MGNFSPWGAGFCTSILNPAVSGTTQNITSLLEYPPHAATPLSLTNLGPVARLEFVSHRSHLSFLRGVGVFTVFYDNYYVRIHYHYIKQADRGCARLRLLFNMCSSKEDGTYYNHFSRYFTTFYGMIHHKKGGTLRRGYGLKEQEMTM